MKNDIKSGVTVVVPVFNEEEAIEATIASLQSTLATLGRPAEILVIDDGSTDASVERASRTSARVIRHPINSGYGQSLLTGIDAAAHDTVIIVDADGSYPIEFLPKLLAMYDKGFDMVVGARQGKQFETSSAKRCLRLIFRLLAEFTCGRSIPDINSGFRVFRKQPVQSGRAAISSGFSFTTTVTLLFMLNHLFVGYLPIPYHQRIGKSKVRILPDALRSFQIIITSIAQFNPLKLFLILFLVCGLGTFGLLFLMSLVQPDATAWLTVVLGWNSCVIIMACALLGLVHHTARFNRPVLK